MKRLSLIISLFLLLAIMSGCATSSKSTNHHFVADQKSVFVSDNFTGYSADHIGEVIRTLEKYGFEITNIQDQSDYYLDFSVEGGAKIRVKITLLKNYKPVVEVSSSNAGWGTVVARRAAVASRVESALEEFDEELAELIVKQ
jgi:hypothetical protein